MSVEDRLRTATRARTELVRDIRPLDLPASAPIRRPGRSGARRWAAWAAPVAAAAVVVALALTLVSLRQARNAPTAPAATQASTSATGTLPKLYVALNSPLRSGPTPFVVGLTGARTLIATKQPPTGQSYVGVTGAADDRTFVLATEAYPARNGTYSGAPTSWYLFRASGPADRGLTLAMIKLAIPAQPKGTQVSGIALSPDGSELAVMFQRNVWSGRKGPLTLAVYSVATGRGLRTWTQPADGAALGYGWYSGQYSNTSITWLDGHTLAFDDGVYTRPGTESLDPVFSDVKIRTVSLTGPGGSLLADSRVVFTVKNPACDTLQLTLDRTSVVCGTSAGSADRKSSAYDPEIFQYTVATGKARVLYRRAGVDNVGIANVLWMNADGSRLFAAVYDMTEQSRGVGTGFVGSGPISNGTFKLLIFPTNGPRFAGGVAF